MRRLRPRCATSAAAFALCVVLTAQSAQATPISFIENFSNAGSLPGPFLEQSAMWTAATFNGVNATFAGVGDWGRSYLRTIDDDYNTASFVAVVTVTIFNNGGAGCVFFGMGVGDPFSSYYAEPRTGSHLFLRPQPDNFAAGAVVVVDQGVETGFLGDLSGTGTHRLQMTWDAGLEEMTFAIHQDYSGGPFVASSTFGPFNGSNNGFNGANARVFFGGTSGTTFDDLVVTVDAETVPEPATLSLLALGGLALLRRRHRRR